jgi:hypothetical protein
VAWTCALRVITISSAAQERHTNLYSKDPVEREAWAAERVGAINFEAVWTEPVARLAKAAPAILPAIPRANYI